MAIKGKRKGKRSRARRPPRPPRLPASVHRSRPFYKTGWGKAIIGSVLAIVAIVVLVAASRARDEARELEERQRNLRSYTGHVHQAHQSVQEIAAAMNVIAPEAAGPELEALEALTQEWSTTLLETEAELAEIAPPLGTEVAHRMFAQAITAYRTAAETYALAPGLPGRARAGVMERAAEIRHLAHSMWQMGADALDGELGDAELDPSRLHLPPPETLPPPEMEESEQEDEGGGG